MPDVWTGYPAILRDLLKEGGFKCGVTPRVLKDRDPAWTCIIDGKKISGDIYIHHVEKLRSELRPSDSAAPMLAGTGGIGDWTAPAILLLLALVLTRWLRAPRGK